MSEQAVYLDDVYTLIEDGLETPTLTLIEGGGEGTASFGRAAVLELVEIDDDDGGEDNSPGLALAPELLEHDFADDIFTQFEDELDAELDAGFTSVGSRRKQPKLTLEQEEGLFGRIETGVLAQERLDLAEAGEIELDRQDKLDLRVLASRGERARERVFIVNQGLVGKMARARLGSGVDFADMFQDGNLGLMRAIESYEFKGYKFSTYATPWIKGAIARGINDKLMPGLPVNKAVKLNTILIARNRLAQELEQEPSPEQIAKEVSRSGPEEVAELLDWWRETRALSTDMVVYGERRPVTFGELIVENTFEDEDKDATAQNEMQAHLQSILGELPPIDAEVVRRRLGFAVNGGLTYDEPQTFHTIAKHMGISKRGAQLKFERTMRQLRQDPRLVALLK